MYALHRTELSTRRLSMRPIRDFDAEALLAIFSNPSVMRYGSTPAWDSIDKALDNVGGEVSDSAIYGLLRDEWLARRSATDPNQSAK